ELKPIVRSLMAEFRIALAEQRMSHLRETDFARAFQNEHEFLSEALSRPDIQQVLASSRVQLDATKKYASPSEWTGRVQTVWRVLIDTVRRILGVPEQHITQLEALLRVTDELWFRGEQSRSITQAIPRQESSGLAAAAGAAATDTRKLEVVP